MNVLEFSDIEIFQHSGKGIPLLMTGHKNCLQVDYKNGRPILFLKTERNKIYAANISNQPARKYEEKFSSEIEGQSSLYPVLKPSTAQYCFFAISHCSVGGFFFFEN